MFNIIFMKNSKQLIGTILAIIFVLSTNSCNKPKQNLSPKPVSESAVSDLKKGKIAYVEIDSIFSHYEMAKELKISFESSKSRQDADLNSKSNSFKSDVADFQNKVQKGLMTQANAQEVQQQLAAREQELYKLSDTYRGQQADEAQVNQRKILQGIMTYLKEYNQDKGFQYILANSFPSSILYADTALNITNEVIEGLNAKYKKEGDHKEKSKK